MVVKVLSIADQEFHLGFKIEKEKSAFRIEKGSDARILIGCFDRNTDLIDYGFKISQQKTKNLFRCEFFEEKVFAQCRENIGYLSEVRERRHGDFSPHFIFLQTTMKLEKRSLS